MLQTSTLFNIINIKFQNFCSLAVFLNGYQSHILSYYVFNLSNIFYSFVTNISLTYIKLLITFEFIPPSIFTKLE